MHLAPLIHDIAVILLVAGAVALLFQKIKQPVVLGYLVAGLIVGPHTPPVSWVVDIEGIRIWSELGVMFLMFAIGLEINLERMKSNAVSILGTALIETALMMTLGFGVARALGFDTLNAVFLGAVIAISSSAVSTKTLKELGLKHAPFIDFVFGVLVIEDLVAILLLVALNTITVDESFSLHALLPEALKLVGIVACWAFFGWLIIPRLMNRVARFATDETLGIFSLGLCLALVLVAVHFHYSPALGAFVMGALMSGSTAASRIEHLLRPLRDVFAAIFFVSIGMLLDPADILNYWSVILIITIVVILGKFSAVFIGAKITRQPTSIAWPAGLALAQIGEFSFIIAELGLNSGKVDGSIYAIAVSVAVLTAFSTSLCVRLIKVASNSGYENRVVATAKSRR